MHSAHSHVLRFKRLQKPFLMWWWFGMLGQLAWGGLRWSLPYKINILLDESRFLLLPLQKGKKGEPWAIRWGAQNIYCLN